MEGGAAAFRKEADLQAPPPARAQIARAYVSNRRVARTVPRREVRTHPAKSVRRVSVRGTHVANRRAVVALPAGAHGAGDLRLGLPAVQPGLRHIFRGEGFDPGGTFSRDRLR